MTTAHAGSNAGNASADAGGTCADLGPHTARLAFGRFHADAPRLEQPATLADTLYTPVIEATGRPASAGLLAIDGGDSLTAAWAKPAESGGGFTLRLHETLGRRGTAELRLADGLTAERVDLRGRPAAEAEPLDGPRVPVPFRPYEVVSVRIGRG